MEKMVASGAQFGYSKTKRHPSAKIRFRNQNNADIIDLNYTEKMLDEATKFIKNLVKKKTILFVSTKPESKKIIESAAKTLNMPLR